MAASEEQERIIQQVIDSLVGLSDAAKEHVLAQNGLIKSFEDGVVKYKKLDQSIEEHVLAQRGLVKTIKDGEDVYETLNENNKSRIKSEQEINAQLLITVGAAKLAIAAAERNEAIKKKLFDDTIRSLGGYIDASNKFVNTTIKLDVAQQQQIKGIEKQIEKQRELNAALVSPGKSFQDAASKTKSLGDIAQQGKAKLNQLAEGSKLASIGVAALEATVLTAAAAITGLYAGAEAMTKSIYSGERGQKVAAKGITATTAEFTKLTESLGGMLIGIGSATIALAILTAPFTGGLSLLAVAGGAAAIGLGGMAQAAGKVAKTLAELNEAAAEQNDKLFEGFNALAQSSMIGARGMTGLMDDLHAMGFVVKDFEKFKKVIDANAKSMTIFGATAEQGVTSFLKTAGDLIKSDLGRTLQLMGITAEDQADHTAKYMAQQANFYALQGKGVKELSSGTAKYIEELDRIAVLTGATRKEQEAARAKINSMSELQAAIDQAQESGDKGEVERLEKAMVTASTFMARGMTDMGTAVAQFAASGGAAVNELTGKFINQSPGLAEHINRGTGTELERQHMGVQESMASRRMMNTNIRFGGIKAASGVLVGADDTQQTSQRNAYMNKGNFDVEAKKAEAAALAKGEKFDPIKFAEEFSKRVATDPRTVKQVDLVRKQQLEYAIDMDNIVADFGDAVDINSLAAKAFEDAVKLFDRAANPEKWKKIDEEKAAAEKAAVIASFDGSDNSEHDETGIPTNKFRNVGDQGVAGFSSSQLLGRAGSKAKAQGAAANLGPDSTRLQTGNGVEKSPTPKSSESTSSGEEKKPVSTRTSRYRRGVADRELDRKDGPSKDGKSQSDLEKMGLRIKEGDVQAENSPVSDKLIELAQKIQGEIPGFRVFTGFNDLHHQKKKPRSEHTQGLALDFGLDKKPSEKEGEDMVRLLKTMGANYARDEYNFPSSGATGGHMHAQISAAMGGIASGPTSGYPATLHGSEMITPLEPNSILEKLAKTAASSPTTESASSVTIDQTMRDMASMHSEMMSMFENKLDDMIGKLGTSNDLQDQLLKYSRV